MKIVINIVECRTPLNVAAAQLDLLLKTKEAKAHHFNNS